MGSLGDKFKKLAGDQTRQLLQNFQNAQSSKTRNGYSYGKLNEDGTATLADGTVVQTVVKGRPGQYAPVFNLGNGQGLVDQPEAKFFNIDSSNPITMYTAWVDGIASYPRIPPYSFTPTEARNYNRIYADKAYIYNYISDEVNEIDPTICSTLPSFSPGTWTFELETPSYDLLFYYQCGPTRCEEYGGFTAIMGRENKDILLFQSSSCSELVKISTFVLSDVNVEANSSDLFIDYVILKDFYINEEGYATSDNVQAGRFNFLPNPYSPPVGLPDFNLRRRPIRFDIWLHRVDGNPRLDILVDDRVFGNFYDSQYYIQSYNYYIARDINGSPVIDQVGGMYQLEGEPPTQQYTVIGAYLGTILNDDLLGVYNYSRSIPQQRFIDYARANPVDIYPQLEEFSINYDDSTQYLQGLTFLETINEPRQTGVVIDYPYSISYITVRGYSPSIIRNILGTYPSNRLIAPVRVPATFQDFTLRKFRYSEESGLEVTNLDREYRTFDPSLYRDDSTVDFTIAYFNVYQG